MAKFAISELRDEVTPTPERVRRGIERLSNAIADEHGRPSQPYRSIDVLGALLRREAITPAMYQAGEDFRCDFAIAQLDPLQASDVSRPMVSGRQRTPILPNRIENARESVWSALMAVGGIGSAGGSCIWHVIGWERTIKEWALEQGWSGRLVSQQLATGILIGALGVLEKHYEKTR